MPASSPLGAMLAAIAAVLIVPISQAHYLMGRDPLLLSFIVVIIGGLGSAARHGGRRPADRRVGRHHLGVLLADAGEDHRHAASSPWCWSSGRRACSGRRRDEGDERRRFRKGYRAACRRHRGAVRAEFRAAGISSRRAGARAGARRLRHGLQSAVRLCRAAQPRPRHVLRRRPLRRGADHVPLRLGRAGGLPRRARLRARCWRSSSACWRCAPRASPS